MLNLLTKNFKRRIFALALAAGLAVTSFGTALPTVSRLSDDGFGNFASAETLRFTDVKGKWFEMYVIKAINYGIISGYDDSNLFRPNNPVTRAEFCTMVNNAFGSTVEAEINFSDVEKGAWYYKPISIGVNSGYILGYDDARFRPNANISRQEAAVIGERLLPYDTEASNIQKYPDYTQVADWAYAAVQRIIKRGYMGTYDDNKIHPTDALTRAQAVKIICDIVDKENLAKTVTYVTKTGKTLSNQVFVGDVVVEKEVAGGEVTFKNCTFLGKLYIYGGGEKSVHLENCRVSEMEVARTDQPTRVVATGYTTVGKVIAKNSVILEEKNLARVMQNSGFNLIYAAEGSTLTLDKGTYTKVRASEGPANITVAYGASLNALTVAAPAAGTSVTVEEGGELINAYAYGACHFLGDERVVRLYCFAEGVTYEKKPFYIETASNVTNGAIAASGELIPVMTPADGATGVEFRPTITISFSKPIHTGAGAKVTSDYIKEVVSFTAKKEGGSATEFKASINDAATIITITPTADLKKKSKFFVYFDEDSFRSQTKNNDKVYDYNKKFSSSFTVGDGSSEGVTFKPVNGARGQATSVKPTITFAFAVSPAAAGVKELDSSYLRSVISFRKVDYAALDDEDTKKKKSDQSASSLAYQAGSDAKIDYESNGKKVTFTAEMAKKNKGISITPKEALENGATYYLAFQDNAFKNAETGEVLGSQFIVFTVGYVVPTVTYTPTDGKAYVSTSDDVVIKFDQVMYTKDSKEIDANYVKNNVKFHDNTAGADVAYTADIDELTAGTKITLDPVSLLADGHEYTVNVPENVFMNKDKKSPVNTSTSFTTGYTTPSIDSISATGTTSVVTASVTANMVASGYVKVLPASAAAPTTVDQVKSGGTAFTSLEGSPTAIAIKGTYTGGEQYKVYAYIYSGSKVTAIKTAAVTVTKDVAAASSFVLQGVDGVTASGEAASGGVGTNVGSAVSVGTSGSETAYTATLPYGSHGFVLTVNPSAATDTVSYDLGGGSSFTAASKAGTIKINVPITSLSSNKVISIKLTGANKIDTTYKLSVKVSGNAALSEASFGGTLGKLDSGTYFVSASTSAITATFTSSDPNAVIKCSPMSGTSSGTGALSGSIPLSATETTVTVTVTSNQDTQTYTYKFTKLQ